MLNCAIYPRKSKQVDNSDSMDVQIDMCKQYLANKYPDGKYTITIYDGDYGITGHSIKSRHDFQRMMQDIKDKKIQLVLIQRYDRIARNTRDFCNLYHDMEVNDCNLVSVSQQIDTTTPYGKNFMYMQASMAELEWALCSERRKDAINYAVSQGKCMLPNHSIPVGFTTTKIDGVRRLVIDKETEPIVRDIIEQYSKYRNYSRATRYVNEKYNINMGLNSVKNLIKSPFLKGCYRQNTNYCEAYLTPSEWDDLQKPKTVIREQTDKIEILFSGLIKCPVCGRKFRAQTKTHESGNKGRYYLCEYSHVSKCTYRKVKSELKIEKSALALLDTLIPEAKSEVSIESKTNNTVKDKSKSINAEIERLNTLFLKGRISEEKYDAEYDRLQNELATNEAQLKSNVKNEKLKSFSKNWKEIYSDLDRLHQKLFWRDLVEQIIVNENTEVIGFIFN